ncbi:MAG: EamA family transporter [Deltaproteobacteria bacterium]|nr:EamA family transporter [Deltaproteobacteria bacterium]
MWIIPGIFSALFLGIYDVCKKWSLRDNNVLGVLFLSNCAALLLTVPVFIASFISPAIMARMSLYAGIPTFSQHFYIIFKTLLVSSSWISAFFALKHLPISIVSPIRASAPLWTLLGATLLFGENFKVLHWVAIGVTFVSYYAFSIIGKLEGISFAGNKWMLLVGVATLTGALSALYDKYLLHSIGINPVTMQVWFSFYLVLVNGSIFLISGLASRWSTKLQWRHTILLIGVFLIVADYLYFKALSHEDAMIAALSIVRRSSVVVSFVVGGILLKELNKRKKMIPLAGVLLGVVLLLF